jgi:hypothetical protein
MENEEILNRFLKDFGCQDWIREGIDGLEKLMKLKLKFAREIWKRLFRGWSGIRRFWGKLKKSREIGNELDGMKDWEIDDLTAWEYFRKCFKNSMDQLQPVHRADSTGLRSMQWCFFSDGSTRALIQFNLMIVTILFSNFQFKTLLNHRCTVQSPHGSTQCQSPLYSVCAISRTEIFDVFGTGFRPIQSDHRRVSLLDDFLRELILWINRQLGRSFAKWNSPHTDLRTRTPTHPPMQTHPHSPP